MIFNHPQLWLRQEEKIRYKKMVRNNTKYLRRDNSNNELTQRLSDTKNIFDEIDVNKNKSDQDDENDRIERAEIILGMEDLFLRWIQIASIFIATAFVIIGLVGKKKKWYGITFFILSIIVLWIIGVQYGVTRNKLLEEGVKVPERLDFLFLIVAFTIVLLVIIIVDYIKPDNSD